jgi:CO dehydrogenase/acetyl-CoA synthase beta subunit/intein/homing endonuclease
VTSERIPNAEVFKLAIEGGKAALGLAQSSLDDAMRSRGADHPVEYPETCYELPAIYGWDGREAKTLGQLRDILASYGPKLKEEQTLANALMAGEATMVAAEVIEALKYLDTARPYEGTPYTGFIPDKVLRELGVAFVDDTIPGAAVIVGKAPDPDALVKIIRDLQSKGILILVSGEVIEQLRSKGVQMGLGLRLYPIGNSTQIVHALNFAIRAGLSFGGVPRGDRGGLSAYLAKRPKVFVLEFGPLDPILAGAAMAAVLNGASIVTDQSVEGIPDKLLTVNDPQKMVQAALEARGVKVKLAPVDVPVAYGPAFEGEVVRRPDTYVEAGGAAKTTAFELLRMRPEDEIEDGRITVIGKDVDEIPAGNRTPLAILVDVYGKRMAEDFESVLERRIHLFVNYAEGAWHTGQRNILWVRLSNAAVASGFRFKHFGDILITKLKEEFGNIVSRVQVTVITDEKEVQDRLPEALEIYAKRDARMAGLVDEQVEEFYSCRLCVPANEDIMMGDGSFMSMEELIENIADYGPRSVMTFATNHMIARSIGEIFINPPPKELVKITLGNWNDLTLTANHKVLVDSIEGLKWIKSGDLQVKDIVVDAMPRGEEDSTGSLSIIDYLPDDYRISDNEFYINLKTWLDSKMPLKEAAKQSGIPPKKLYYAFDRNQPSRRRLTIAELKKIVSVIGVEWDGVKELIHTFQWNVTLSRTRLDADIMYTVGLIASDGHVHWRGEGGRSGVTVQFTNSEPALTYRFAEIIGGLFGRLPCEDFFQPSTSRSETFRIEPSKPLIISHVHNTLYGRLLNGLGIGFPKGAQKWKGNIISKLPDELVAAFLRGLFDGDGHVSRTRFGFTTRSRLEARHVHLLLRRFGIATRIVKVTRGYQVMSCSDGDAILFRELIGSCHPEKRDKLDAIVQRSDPNHVVRSDTVSIACGPVLFNLLNRYGVLTNHLPVDYKSIMAWRKGHCRPSKDKLRKVLDAIEDSVPSDDPNYVALRAWTNSNVRFQKIRSVEFIPCETDRLFNFSVDETHNYTVNGIVVKNCQSFAPDHVCVVTPERLGLCGAINWLDAKAACEIDPHGPNQAIIKGQCIDEVKGQWQGVNEAVYEASHHKLERFNAYTMMEDPMTSCGCFEVIVGMTADMQAVIVVNREYPGMTPIGMKFSTLAGSVGGGKQTPGFIGVGRKYITSRKFIPADGGFLRIAWMPRELKESMREALRQRAQELGEPDFLDKIADETVTTEAEGLMEWMVKVDHPALRMPPLLS